MAQTQQADKQAQQTASDDIELLLSTIKQQLEESHITHSGFINLDSSLGRDLGFDSLSRVELIARIERSFNIALPDRVVINTETPRDLLRAIHSTSTRPGFSDEHEAKAVRLGSAQPAPQEAKTLIEVLQWHVAQHPHRPHLALYNSKGSDNTLTYQQLFTNAKTVASGLQNLDIQPGEPVSIMLPTSEEYFYSYFGILLAGGIPVPLYPPANLAQLEDHMRRHVGILNNCMATLLITVPEAKKIARLLKSQVSSLKHIVTMKEISQHAGAYTQTDVGPQSIAFIQYTSGSTGSPKGVVLTHSNLLANIRAMGHAVKATSEDVFISWLPLYHDMGLIGGWLGSLYFSFLLATMSPLTFLRHPEKWLWAIHEYKGTLSASPNFGFELCIRRLTEQQLQGLDLSSWRAAFNGAETVSPETMRRFYEKFRHYGFKQEAIMPVYGLAENSVGLAFPPVNRGMHVDSIQRARFMRNGEAIPADAGDHEALQFVSCGYPLINHQIRIVDKANRELPERIQGHLQFHGPSSTSGYFRNPEQTKQLFNNEWLDSGDLAYIANGEVYLTGRVKDIIIRAGRNIYPHELEECVGNIDGIRAGRVTAFGSRDPHNGTERLVIVAETRETDSKNLTKLRSKINAAISALAGTPPDEIVLAPPNSILKTSSGKLRRAASREVFEKGDIGKKQKAVWLQVLRFMAKGFTSELRKTKNTTIRLLYGLYARTVFWILAITAWTAVVLAPNTKWRWTIIRKCTALLAKLTGTSIKVSGVENLLASDEPCVYVANHASYLDGPILMYAIPRTFSFIAKSELKHEWISKLFLDRIDAEYVERFDLSKGLEDIENICETAKSGRSLFFFPEGTFIRRPGILPFHLGAFVAAVEAKLPVVPVTIRGTRSILRADSWLPNRGSIHIYIDTPLEVSLGGETEEDTWSVANKLRDTARRQVLRNSGEPDLSSEPVPFEKS